MAFLMQHLLFKTCSLRNGNIQIKSSGETLVIWLKYEMIDSCSFPRCSLISDSKNKYIDLGCLGN